MDDGGDCQCEEGAPAWMATFSDLATLLLTFFVLLLSFANMDIQSFHEVLGSVKQALGVKAAEPGMIEATASKPVVIDSEGSTQLALDTKAGILATQMQGKLEEAGMEGEVEIEASPRGLVLRIKDRVLFAVGSDELQPGAGKLLEVVADLAREFEQDIAIEGHTDDRPIRTSRFPSNWELSTARATSVLRDMERRGIDITRMGVAGYAETRPVAPNDTSEGRQRNRRVEFIFLSREEYSGDKKKTAPGAPEANDPTKQGTPSILAPAADGAPAPASDSKTGTETTQQQGDAAEGTTPSQPAPGTPSKAGDEGAAGQARDALQEASRQNTLDSLQGNASDTRRLPDGRIRQFLIPMGSAK